MKFYNIIEDEIIMINGWIGLADLQKDYKIFLQPEIANFLEEILDLKNLLKKMNEKTEEMRSYPNLKTDMEIFKKYQEEIKRVSEIFIACQKYEKYVDIQTIEENLPQHLKGKRIIISGIGGLNQPIITS